MLEKLLEAILLGTQDNTIIWKKSYSILDSDISHEYTCVLNSDTNIQNRILLNIDGSFRTMDHLIIKNDKLVTGQKFISCLDINYKPFLIKIGNELYDRYIKPNIKHHDTEDSILGDILSDMPNKAQLRDNKISDILSDSDSETIKTSETIVETSEIIVNDSLFKKIKKIFSSFLLPNDPELF